MLDQFLGLNWKEFDDQNPVPEVKKSREEMKM